MRCELSPTRRLKCPVLNRVQITCNTSNAYHVQQPCDTLVCPCSGCFSSLWVPLPCLTVDQVVSLPSDFLQATRDFLQSPSCAMNCLPHVGSSVLGAIVCKSHATQRALITCNNPVILWSVLARGVSQASGYLCHAITVDQLVSPPSDFLLVIRPIMITIVLKGATRGFFCNLLSAL